jgi:hypothetical protein
VVALIDVIPEVVPRDFLFRRHRPSDHDRTGGHIDADILGMWNGIGNLQSECFAPPDLALPIFLVMGQAQLVEGSIFLECVLSLVFVIHGLALYVAKLVKMGLILKNSITKAFS